MDIAISAESGFITFGSGLMANRRFKHVHEVILVALVS